jgi:hypothetical protein
MTRHLAAVLAFSALLAAAAAPAAAIDPPTALRDRAVARARSSPESLLKSLLVFSETSDPVFAASLRVVVACVRKGGDALLSAGADVHGSPIVSLGCTVDGEPATATMSARHLAFFNENAYNRAMRPMLRVSGRRFGYGAGEPAAVPTGNWTDIGSAHVGPAVRLYVEEREYLEANPYPEL